MRIRQTISNKTSGGVYATYNYTYSGTKLVHMTVYNDDLHFFYDNQGRPAKVKYNGEMYTYLHNLQGDIVGIVDDSGALVVEYKYNSWGTLLSRTGSMAGSLGYRNPFRYRGYIYDEETWMYWLKSRYYYPKLHRFINADEDIRGNLYEYCRSNPVNRLDHSGTRSISHMREMAKLHDRVANLVALKVFGRVERTLTFTPKAGRRGGPGYPDVIVTTSNMVWEVKPKTLYGVTTGAQQMKNYTDAGRTPGYPVKIDPFPYTLNGKEGMVYVTNAVPVPVTIPADDRKTSYNLNPAPGWGTVALLGIALIATALSPVPGDEALAGAAFLAAIH